MTDPYCPNLPTYCNILRDYAIHGQRYFDGLSGDVQKRIRGKLGGHIETDGYAIDTKFKSIKDKKSVSSPFRFLPMPKPGSDEFQASFFLPKIDIKSDDKYECSFNIIFWIDKDGGKTIAVRLEPPMQVKPSEEDADAHRYSHLQLTATCRSPDVATDLPAWAPQSYPGFPLAYRHPLQFFIGMVISVHGYNEKNRARFASQTIKDSMKTAAAAQTSVRIFAEMERTFGYSL